MKRRREEGRQSFRRARDWFLSDEVYATREEVLAEVARQTREAVARKWTTGQGALWCNSEAEEAEMAGRMARRWMTERQQNGILDGGMVNVLVPRREHQDCFTMGLMAGTEDGPAPKERRGRIGVDEGAGEYRFEVGVSGTLSRRAGYGHGVTLAGAFVCGAGVPRRHEDYGLLGAMTGHGDILWRLASGPTYWELLMKEDNRRPLSRSPFWRIVGTGQMYAKKLRESQS